MNKKQVERKAGLMMCYMRTHGRESNNVLEEIAALINTYPKILKEHTQVLIDKQLGRLHEYDHREFRYTTLYNDYWDEYQSKSRELTGQSDSIRRTGTLDTVREEYWDYIENGLWEWINKGDE